MANDKNKNLANQSENDELEELLLQIGSIEGSDLNLVDFTKAALEGIGNELSDDELEGLLNESFSDDAELENMATSFAQIDIVTDKPDEDEEGEETELEAASEQLEPDVEAVVEPDVEPAVEPVVEPDVEPADDVSETEPQEEFFAELPELSPDESAAETSGETSEPFADPLTDEEQLADLLAEVSDELNNTAVVAERTSKPTEVELPAYETDSFEYLKELGGPDGALDGLEEEQDESFDEIFDAPDFSFNESFTQGDDDKSDGAKPTITKGFAPKSTQKKHQDETEPEKPKRAWINPDSSLYKVLAPVAAKLSPISNAAKKVKGKAGGAKKKLVRNKRAQMLTTIIIMLLLLIVSGLLLYRQYQTMRRIIEENRVLVGSPPSQRLNYANYIYAGNSKTLGDKSLLLSKLIIDEYMSAFYFDAYLNEERYFAELRDDEDNYYCLYPLPANDEETTVYWFDGAIEGVKQLHLTIYDKALQEFVVFDVEMEDYEMLPAKYVDNSKEARTQEYSFDASVEGGAFSSSMSTVVYRFEGKSGVKIGYGGEGGASSRISLENTDRATLPLLSTPKEYTQGNVTVGRMDFGPVRSLVNKGRLTFGSLCKNYELNRFFSAAPIFDNTSGEGMSIDFDSYRLVLEGVKKYDGVYVLVYHFEDMAGERVFGEFDATLLIQTYSGLEISLEPYTYYTIEGGDMIFEYSTPNSVIDNAGPEEVFIDIAAARIKIPDVVTDILIPDLAETPEEANYAAVRTFAEKAYTGRLAVKSGADGVDLSQWFSADILSDTSLGELYEPISVSEPCEYAVMVHTLAKLSPNEYFAVVEESWLGINGSDREHYYKTHEIIVKQNGDNFVITDDTID